MLTDQETENVSVQDENKAIIENSLNEIYIFDAHTLRFIYINKGARMNMGYSLDEIRQLTPIDIKPDYTTQQFYELMRPLLDNKKPQIIFKTRHSRKDGSTYKALIHVQKGWYQGKEAFYAIILDITEQEDLIAQLQVANEELEEFAYRTSHDLKAPLTSAVKLIEITKECINSGQTEKALEAMDICSTSLNKLETLIGDILVLTKAKNEKEESGRVSLDAVIQDVCDKLSYLDGFNKIKIIKDIKNQDEVYTKKIRLQLILENLLSNAVKYADFQKEAPFIKISSFQEGELFVLSVEDNGLGIPRRNHSDIFSMFKRFHTKTSTGSGLGLYMVKKSAIILGGNIAFEDLGNGSRFLLKIPLEGIKTHNASN